MAQKKIEVKKLDDNLVVVKFIKNKTPYVKGDITAIQKGEFAKLSKMLIVEKI